MLCIIILLFDYYMISNMYVCLYVKYQAAKKSKMEFERHLGMLKARRGDLEARVAANKEWGAKYDLEVGPFAKRYENMTAEIGQLYNNAKKGHAKGIVLLEQEFGYHPAFKRPGDTFTATPFRPA